MSAIEMNEEDMKLKEVTLNRKCELSNISAISNNNIQKKTISFGLVTDCHYIDIDDGYNYNKTVMRRYRQSLDILKEASYFFNKNNTTFNILLGDIIDGQAKNLNLHLSGLNTVKDTISICKSPWYYVIGNHECYNFTRFEMYNLLIPSTNQPKCTPEKLYYSYTPQVGFRCIILDGYEISVMNATTKEYTTLADMIVREKNHNYAAGSSNWFKDIPTENERYVPFNGQVSKDQVLWLENVLKSAIASGEKCIVFCHMPLYLPVTHEKNLLWNCEEVLDVLHQANAEVANTVLLCVGGHDHNGGYSVDSHGIHHLVPPSPIECALGEVSYGRIEVTYTVDSVGTTTVGTTTTTNTTAAVGSNSTNLTGSTEVVGPCVDIEWIGKTPHQSRMWPTKVTEP